MIGDAIKTRRGARWMIIVVLLLAAHASLMTWAAIVATGDPNFVVIPNYYDKALNWDKDQARRSASAQLGWKVQIDVGTARDALGRQTLTLRLVDHDGAPVPVDTLDVEAFHEASAASRLKLVVRATQPGTFPFQLPVHHSGFHQIEVNARLGSLEFVELMKCYVPMSPKGDNR